jgi:hypothetical protein
MQEKDETFPGTAASDKFVGSIIGMTTGKRKYVPVL